MIFSVKVIFYVYLSIPFLFFRCSKYPSDSINSNIGTSTRRLSIVSNPGSTEYLFTSTEKTEKTDPEKLLDDRMHTPCSENGKHKCNCDDESDGNHRSSSSISETNKLDERYVT